MSIDTNTTTPSGNAITLFPAEMEIDLIVYMYAIRRKYRFDALLNCVNKFSGRNVKRLYFEVRIELLQKVRACSSCFCFEVLSTRMMRSFGALLDLPDCADIWLVCI